MLRQPSARVSIRSTLVEATPLTVRAVDEALVAFKLVNRARAANKVAVEVELVEVEFMLSSNLIVEEA